MALPTKERTWQFAVNQQIPAGATTTDTCKAGLLAIKNSLKDFAISPWVVVGSSNASVAAMDGVDRWTNASALSWASSTQVRSWIVFSNPGLAPFQFCIECKSGSALAANINVAFSVGGLFTGGSTTNRPTATDEVVANTGSAWAVNANIPMVIHVMQSTDGLATRVIVCSSGVSQGLWLLEKAASIPTPLAGFPGWTSPIIVHAGANAAAGSVYATHNTFNDTANVYAYANGAVMNCFLTEEGYGAAMIGEQFASAANELFGEWPMCQAGIASGTTGRRGRHGRVVDLWWGATVHSDGTTYPLDGTRQFVQFGHVIHPWNGSTPVMV